MSDTKTVEKGWGSELIWADTDMYCGKLLKFKTGSKSSMHMHKEKDETWLVLKGVFKVTIIDTTNAQPRVLALKSGDTLRLEPMVPHRVECMSEGTIIEVSTRDSVEDNYRVFKGDSQT